MRAADQALMVLFFFDLQFIEDICVKLIIQSN